MFVFWLQISKPIQSSFFWEVHTLSNSRSTKRTKTDLHAQAWIILNMVFQQLEMPFTKHPWNFYSAMLDTGLSAGLLFFFYSARLCHMKVTIQISFIICDINSMNMHWVKASLVKHPRNWPSAYPTCRSLLLLHLPAGLLPPTFL